VNARELLGNLNIPIVHEVDTRKDKFEEAAAVEILEAVDIIHVGCRGKFLKMIPDNNKRQQIMAEILGRSGTLRAPALRCGEVMLVGFNEEMYRDFFLNG